MLKAAGLRYPARSACFFPLLEMEPLMSQPQGIIAAIRDGEPEFIAIRQAIHAHPELGF